MSTERVANHSKPIPNSTAAYEQLKVITDAAQAGDLKPWSPAIVELLAAYDVSVERLKDLKVQVTLSFPTSRHNSMAIGFRYAKPDGNFAEDLFLFEENVGLTCFYRGSQEEALPEYDGTHHLKLRLTEFLPDLQREVAAIRQQVSDLAAKSGIEFISDEQFEQEMHQIQQEFEQQVRSFAAAHGHTGALRPFSVAAQKIATKKRIELKAKKAASDRAYKPEPPEISVMIGARGGSGRFNVTITSNAGKQLVAEKITVAGVETDLEQQFSKMYPVRGVNFPHDIFEDARESIEVAVYYRTLNGQHFKYTNVGIQEQRADKRYNIIFPKPPKIEVM